MIQADYLAANYAYYGKFTPEEFEELRENHPVTKIHNPEKGKA